MPEKNKEKQVGELQRSPDFQEGEGAKTPSNIPRRFGHYICTDITPTVTPYPQIAPV